MSKLNTRSKTTALREFLHQETAGGVVMIFSALLALILANSAFSELYQGFVRTPLAFGFSVSSAVNDVLMPLFFLLVGMELKKEMREGFLAPRGQKILPLIAAAGGIIVPALIYIAINHGIAENRAGWAIPTATDIAFAVCVLSFLGKRVPQGAKIFLLAIAIYDDLAAILIIALFYSHGIALVPLAVGGVITLLMVMLNRRSVGAIWPYMLLGVMLWLCLHEAHIHTTVAGMLTGLCIPLTIGKRKPLAACMKQLHPPVAFLVLPLFAFVSAGVSFTGLRMGDLLEPLPLGIALGLFLGKPLGIFSATYIGVRAGLASKPAGTSWLIVLGIAATAGIGFTMSLFIGFLAFHTDGAQEAIKLGVLTGSFLSAAVGLAILRWALCKS